MGCVVKGVTDYYTDHDEKVYCDLTMFAAAVPWCEHSTLDRNRGYNTTHEYINRYTVDVLHASQAFGPGLRMDPTKSMTSTFATRRHPLPDTTSTKPTTSTGMRAVLTLLIRICLEVSAWNQSSIPTSWSTRARLLTHEMSNRVTQCCVAVSMVKITETILQGVVLFGMATTITTFIASYLGGYVFAGKSTHGC